MSTFMTKQRIELCKSKARVQPWFLRLVGANGETLAVSEGYFSHFNAKRAAKKNFAGIRMVDTTGKA